MFLIKVKNTYCKGYKDKIKKYVYLYLMDIENEYKVLHMEHL